MYNILISLTLRHKITPDWLICRKKLSINLSWFIYTHLYIYFWKLILFISISIWKSTYWSRFISITFLQILNAMEFLPVIIAQPSNCLRILPQDIIPINFQSLNLDLICSERNVPANPQLPTPFAPLAWLIGPTLPAQLRKRQSAAPLN